MKMEPGRESDEKDC